MNTLNRRTFLRNGIMLGAAAAMGGPGLRLARAAESQTLTLYNGQHPRTTAALVQAFTQATGIQVEIRKGGSSQLANQIIEEGEHSPADVFYSEESPPLAALAKRRLLSPLNSETLQQVLPGYTSKDGTWTGVSARRRVVAYNRGMIAASELPASIMDMATEAWRGKVGFVPTSGAFPAAAHRHRNPEGQAGGAGMAEGPEGIRPHLQRQYGRHESSGERRYRHCAGE